MFTTLGPLVIGAALGAPVAIVGIGDGEAHEASVARATATEAGTGSSVLPATELASRLCGTPELRSPDVAGLERMLADARDREARFDSKGAAALRAELLRAFDRAPRPGTGLRGIAAAAAQDAAAALLNEGDAGAADAAALEALRRFGSVPLDAARHAPAVQTLFARARAALGAQPTGQIEVASAVAGTLWADGTQLGSVDGTLRATVPRGPYRLWLETDAGELTLAHAVEVGETPIHLVLQTELETRVDLQPVIRVRCSEDCPQLLRQLGTRLGVERIVGIYAEDPPRGIVVGVAEGETTPWSGAAVAQDAQVAATRAKFSPWYLVPFGGGQFAQGRPLFGGGYAAVQAGLLAWHLVAWQRHAAAIDVGNHLDEPDLRFQRNVSVGLFYGSLVANIAEALLVGYFTGS